MNEDKLIVLICVAIWMWLGVWGHAYWWNKKFNRFGILENWMAAVAGPVSFILGGIFYQMFK